MEINLNYAFFTVLLLFMILKLIAIKKLKLPPSPGFAIPLLGHAYLFKLPLHQTYHCLSKKLGPIFSIRFGSRLIVVVSSPELFEECFTKNDIILANRPRVLVGKYTGYNYTSLISIPYGEHWRNLRRITATEVFSSARLNKFMHMREDEIKVQLKNLYKKSKQYDFVIIELKNVFTEITFNNIMRMVSGKRFENDDIDAKQFRDHIVDILSMSHVSNPGDFFPILSLIDYKGFEKNLANIAQSIDLFLQTLVDEHRQNKSASTMVDHLLSLQETEPAYYSDIIIKGIVFVMLLAGTDTSAVTLEWAMTCLLNHPEKLEKVRVEIESLVGNERLVNESDLPNLPYLQNVISETFRLLPTAPLLVPHEASCDCKIGGYDIPKGTIVQVNTYTIHHDPIIWEDPLSFKPERFEVGEIGPTKLIPFGMGRRACPGNNLAMRVVGLGLASFLQCFEWKRVDKAKIDLTEGSGATMPKAIPLVAKYKPREMLRKILSNDGKDWK